MDYPRNTQFCRCGKVIFTKKDAQAKKNYIERETGRPRLTIYQCGMTKDHWHLTKLNKYKK